MASGSKRGTGVKTVEQVTLIVVYNGSRVPFTFHVNTKVRDVLKVVSEKFKLNESSAKSLLHGGRVMLEDATLGNFEGTTAVHLVDKREVTSQKTAVVEGIQDHDKYFGFCSSCKLLVNVRPIVYHCQESKFVFDSTAVPDYHSDTTDLRGKCLACQADCRANVTFQCMACQEKYVAFLRLVRKNTSRIPCINCTAVSDCVLVFPCASRHCMCLQCYPNYCQAMMNSDLFRTFPEVGYSVSCPVSASQCQESPILDPHHFCLVDNKGPFYKQFKEKSEFHIDLPETSILCIVCKNEIDMSSGKETHHTAPVGEPQENVAGIGWFMKLIRRFTGPVEPPPPPRGRKQVSCRKCQVMYCCECKMAWHEGRCHHITEAIKEQEKFKIKPENAQRGRWPNSV